MPHHNARTHTIQQLRDKLASGRLSLEGLPEEISPSSVVAQADSLTAQTGRSKPDTSHEPEASLEQFNGSTEYRREQQTAAFSFPVSGESLLSHLLPARRLPGGSLVEWLAESEGTGAATLAFLAAASLLKAESVLLVVDDRRMFYPPSACALGLDPGSTVVVRPENTTDTLWALEQSLRCSGAITTIGWLDRIDDRAYRRLKLAAERGNNIGQLIRPTSFQREPSWADIRLGVSPRTNKPNDSELSARRVCVEVLRCRWGADGRNLELDICDETGHVHLVSPMASAKAVYRAAGA
jgi:hypothetical protein